MEKSPLVTVAIPTFNSERFITSALDSITKQTYSNIECIVVDNRSTDNTIKMARGYEQKIRRFYVYINSENIGAYRNWNRCIELAKGEYIAIYHSDDIYDKKIIEESVNVLQDENIAVVSTLAGYIDENNKPLRQMFLPRGLRHLGCVVFGFKEISMSMISQIFDDGFIATPSVMVKKKVYEKLGLFDPLYRSACDYEMWLRIARQFKFAVINKQMYLRRIHRDTLTYTEVTKKLDLPDINLVFEWYFRNSDDRQLRNMYKRFYGEAVVRVGFKLNQNKQFRESNSFLKKAAFKNMRLAVKVLYMTILLHNKIKMSVSYYIVRKIKRAICHITHC
jgi:glycosyltransferase involved in cell wall biosynthesis